MAIFAILLFALIIVFTYYLLRFLKSYWSNITLVTQFPGPSFLPFIGNAHQLELNGNLFYKQLMEFSHEFRDHPVFRIWIGTVPLMICHHAESVEKVLGSTKHLTKALQYNFLHSWLGTGLLTSHGDKWRIRRKMLTPAFHFSILKDFMSIYNDQAKILVETVLMPRTNSSAPVDIFPMMIHATLDIICETAMGKKLHAQTNSDTQYIKAYLEIAEIVMNRVKNPLMYSDFIFRHSAAGRRQAHCLKIVHDFTNSVIASRRKSFNADKETQSHNDDDTGVKRRLAFIDLMLKTSFTDGESFTDENIREEVDTFMFEGHDTTAAALSWCLYLLAANPQIQAEVHKEIDLIWTEARDSNVEDDFQLNHSDVSRLPLLERCIKEALRLYPSVPFFGRQCDPGLSFDGKSVPPGTNVLLLAAGLHRLENVFPEPDRFNPDRFLPELASKRHAFSYVPFSAGPRNCIGAKFANLEEKVVLTWILRHFELRTSQSVDDLHPNGELILRPANGIWVTLLRRTE